MAHTTITHEELTQQQEQGWEEECYQIGCEVARDQAYGRLSAVEERLHNQRPFGWKVQGWRKRVVMTRFGEVTVIRRLYRDQQGTYHMYLDEYLGWSQGQSATPSLTEAILDLSTHVPYRMVEQTVEKLTGGVVSAMTVHRMVQRVGQRAIEDEEESWRACFERGEQVHDGDRGVKVLYTEADGVWVHLQREGQSHYELKSGICYEGWRRLPQKEERYELVNKRVYCQSNRVIPFWEGAGLEWSKEYDLSQVDVVIVGGDGANWIEGHEREGLGCVIGQLDGFHLARACGRALGKDAGKELYKAIRKGEQTEAYRLLELSEPATTKGASKGASKARAYVQARVSTGADWRVKMTDVPDGARSLGTMESNGDKLVANRLKKRGMSWSRAGVERLAKVIQLRANGELAQHCRSRVRPLDEQYCRFQARRRSLSTKRSHDQWLKTTMPALVGPHAARSWVQGLNRLAHNHYRLN